MSGFVKNAYRGGMTTTIRERIAERAATERTPIYAAVVVRRQFDPNSAPLKMPARTLTRRQRKAIARQTQEVWNNA